MNATPHRARRVARARTISLLVLAAVAASMATVAAQISTTSATTSPPTTSTATPAPTPQLTPTDGCCALCIGKTTDLPYTYDPVIHSQCSAARGVCCYNCGQEASAQMTVVNGAFGADGVTPQVKAGEWAQVQWPNVARVTYETYQAAQKKTSTVRNGSFEARASGGSFWICAKTQGSYIYARGWGADPCRSATKENRIDVIAGRDSDSCGRLPTEATSSKVSGGSAAASGSGAPAPAASSAGKNNSSAQALTQGDIVEQTCNTQRATIVVNADGTKKCVCAAEWTGPPSCDGFPWWKIALTVGGGVAAVLSIIVSVRAYLSTRKARRATTGMSPDAVLGSDAVPVVAHEGYERHRQRESDMQQAPSRTRQSQPSREYTL